MPWIPSGRNYTRAEADLASPGKNLCSTKKGDSESKQGFTVGENIKFNKRSGQTDKLDRKVAKIPSEGVVVCYLYFDK